MDNTFQHFGVKLVSFLAPIAASIGTKKVSDVIKNRKQEKSIFESWGQNILNTNLKEILWKSEDGKYRVRGE